MVPKTEKLVFRVLPTHKQALEDIAHRQGEAMSVVVRQLILDRARELGISPVERQKEERSDPAPAAA